MLKGVFPTIIIVLLALALFVGCAEKPVLYSSDGPDADQPDTAPPEELTYEEYVKTQPQNTTLESDSACAHDSDCVPAECCHPASCILAADKKPCNLMCTMECRPGTMDCGQGSCKCNEGKCEAVLG